MEKIFLKEVGKNAVQREVRRTTNALIRKVIVGSIAVTILVAIIIVIAIVNKNFMKIIRKVHDMGFSFFKKCLTFYNENNIINLHILYNV